MASCTSTSRKRSTRASSASHIYPLTGLTSLNLRNAMWQRIQTLYLILVSVLMVLFALSDIFLLSQPGGQALLVDAWSLHDVATGERIGGFWSIGVLSVVSALIALGSVFLYKRRVLQARIGMGNVILLAGLVVLIFYVGYTYSKEAMLGFKFALALPFVSIILQVLAVRGILSDETLVRLSNRLR